MRELQEAIRVSSFIRFRTISQTWDDENLPDSLSSSTHTPESNAFPDAASTTCGSIHESSGTAETDNQSTQVYSTDDTVSMDGHAEGDAEVEGPPHPDMAAAAALITAAVSSASASFINPSFFSGTANEDARDWLTYLENWIRYKNLNAEANNDCFRCCSGRKPPLGSKVWTTTRRIRLNICKPLSVPGISPTTSVVGKQCQICGQGSRQNRKPWTSTSPLL